MLESPDVAEPHLRAFSGEVDTGSPQDKCDHAKEAFSGEVETGSPPENASD
jgi:hypothetical protein